MDLNQLIIALIGAGSTLFAAWLNLRAKQKLGLAPSKRSRRRTIIKFSFYFILGGAATYWVMNSLLPFGRIDERLNTLEGLTQSLMKHIGFVQTADSVPIPALPVGSVILSTLPPEKFAQLPDGSTHWAPADGRALDSSSHYAVLTGSTRAPDLAPLRMGQPATDFHVAADSVLQRLLPAFNTHERSDTIRGTTLYWYIRIN